MRFPFDNWIVALLVLAALGLAARAWLHDHPEHNPWAPLSIDDPPGWATARKVAALRDDPQECRNFLVRSDIAFEELDPIGEGQCRRDDRLALDPDPGAGLDLRPAGAAATCPVNAGLALWMRQSVQPAAQRHLGSRVERIGHLGTYSCRRIGGGESGTWSEHATGNSIDIAAFVLEDGQRIAVLQDWDGGNEASRFLRQVRDDACGIFGTVLSPEYNAAHADHLHLDQAGRGRGWTFCR
ncbi:extensin [Novosphingobium marinum]|uniref:Extensin-like C-terminal domain-containing protein n=1 Tax=Novosphingobium marinum TaxID=1514948 RepID=A0A7Z0BSG8_9SPHN|nr:extensin family protein [Novosphingobium marinum]NYH94114.1 hypothetical protein [Novosphingobium marinum]GGC19679.1 extensin [Novosphingobium marinum]